MSSRPSIMATAALDNQLTGEEPWDDNTVLYMPFPVEQILLPEYAVCLAVQTYLKMAALPFSVEYRKNAEFMSPTGRVPFIRSGRFIKADFDPIVEFVESKDISLSKNVSKDTKCDMITYISLMNTTFLPAETYCVWCDPVILPETNRRYGCVYPFPLNHILTYIKRKDCKARLKSVSWLNKSLEEVYGDVRHGCETLCSKLGKQKYFYGEEPTEVDALVFGHLYSITTTSLRNDGLAEIIAKYDTLTDYIKRIDSDFYKSPSS